MIDVWPIQVAMYQTLTAMPQTYPVYDAVPQNAPFPYIVIGEISMLPGEELEDKGVDASVMVHGWSRQAGKAEAHAILEFVRDRLDYAEIGGAWACWEDFAEVMEDRSSTAASRLYHAAARYRVRANQP